MNPSRPWGDWMLEEEEEQSQLVLKMTDEEWKECGKKAIADQRGNGDLRPVLNWLYAMDALRAERLAKAASPLIVRDMRPAAVAFRVWKDMVEEPAKYGEADWQDWLALNDRLRAGPGRWRLEAFWHARQAEEETRVHEHAATRIQAAWRGHRVRDTLPSMHCANCLTRTFALSPYQEKLICAECLTEEYEQLLATTTVAAPLAPAPDVEVDENDMTRCYGCGRWNCYVGDHGEYRPGYWCSRACAYD